MKPDEIKKMQIASVVTENDYSKYDRDVCLNTDGTISARIFDVDDKTGSQWGTEKVLTSTTVVDVDKWVHIAFTVNENDTFILYIDGVKEAEMSCTTAFAHTSPKLLLGQVGNLGDHFEGSIQNVTAYKMVLTPEQIALFPDYNVISEPRNFYVDSTNGSDTASGESEVEAWRTLDKLNQVQFSAGDTINLKCGSNWTGTLQPQGSGIPDQPIRIISYGDGVKPCIDGLTQDALRLYNQEYWEISDIALKSSVINMGGHNSDGSIKSKTDPSWEYQHAVKIHAQDAGTLNHIYLKNLDISNVKCTEAKYTTAAVQFLISGDSIPTSWNDIKVEGCTVSHVDSYGILMASSWSGGGSTWGHADYRDELYGTGNQAIRYSTNVVISNNYIDSPGTAAICPIAVDGAVIEYNVCSNGNSTFGGNVPVWWTITDDIYIQNNEVYGTIVENEDSQAFDSDGRANRSYVQYNYSHDNPSGFFFVCALGSDYEIYLRYNISQNDGGSPTLHGTQNGAFITIGGSSSQLGTIDAYNNTFYFDDNTAKTPMVTSNWDGVVADPSRYKFFNNIFYVDNANDLGWDENLRGTVSNNLYYNSKLGGNSPTIRTDDSNRIVGDPMLMAAGTGGTGNGPGVRGNVDGYKLQDDSPCVEAGRVIANNGGKDYWGNPVSDTRNPNIGASNVQKSGTILMYAHQDDDLLWMLPYWEECDKIIEAAIPSTPTLLGLVEEQQRILDENNTGIDYAGKWEHPWGEITDKEYVEYYWNGWSGNIPSGYEYVGNGRLSTYWDINDEAATRIEVEKLKTKLESYISSPDVERIITHNSWGEYGHIHHRALNTAVCELAATYGKEVWVLNVETSLGSNSYTDKPVPEGSEYESRLFDLDLFRTIRNVYQNTYMENRTTWTWDNAEPGTHNFIKQVSIPVVSNYAVEATVTATSEDPSNGVSNINDADAGTSFVSVDNPSLPEYLTFTWNTPKTINEVLLKSWWCQGQAPTNWNIEVSVDGSTGWTNVASSGDVSWLYNTSEVESKSIVFPTQSNIKGLRIKINNANLSWNHYAILEAEIYGDTQ